MCSVCKVLDGGGRFLSHTSANYHARRDAILQTRTINMDLGVNNDIAEGRMIKHVILVVLVVIVLLILRLKMMILHLLMKKFYWKVLSMFKDTQWNLRF